MDRILPYLVHPEKMDATAIKILDSLIIQYPYCSTLHLLEVIALGNAHSTLFGEKLKEVAIQIPDRSKLFGLTNHGKEEWGAILELMNRDCIKSIQSDGFELIDRYLEQQHMPEGMTSVAAYDATLALEQLNNVNETPENYSSTYLDEESGSISSDTNPAQNDNNQDWLIDNFIEAEKNGTLFVPETPSETNDSINESADLEHIKIKDKAFLTESLAKVYIKQHKFEQALSIIQDLSIRFPEKNVYLCDQIRFLEKIISFKNNKNN